MLASRKLRRISMCPWLLVIAILLRSFIAPGFMLSVSADDGLGIIFCDGPVSFNTTGDEHAHHHGDNANTQDATHISPVCSQWSTSSVLVLDSYLILYPGVFPEASFENRYQSPALVQFRVSSRVTRGPPLSNLIV